MRQGRARTALLAAALCAAAAPSRGGGNVSPRSPAAALPPGLEGLALGSGSDPWLGTVAALASVADNIPVAGFDGFGAAAPYLELGSDRFNPGLARPLLELLSREPAAVSREALEDVIAKLRGGEDLDPQERDVLRRFSMLRNLASANVAQMIAGAAERDQQGQVRPLSEVLAALEGSGLYAPQSSAIRVHGEAALAAARRGARSLREFAADSGGASAVKPDPEGLGPQVKAALRSPAVQNDTSKEPPTVAVDPATIEARERARKFGSLGTQEMPISVLLDGETGSGKEILAQVVHANSDRRRKPFKAINVAAQSELLFIAQLFGFKKGAFTGADRDTPGLLTLTDGGTLFIDEIGELPVSMQITLLTALRDGFRPVGADGKHPVIKVNVRIVAATHRNLDAMAAAGKFSKELLGLIGTLRVEMPPLRRRPADILPLAQFFLDPERAERGRAADKTSKLRISPEAARVLMAYRWPGNVRELKHAMESAAILVNGSEIRPEDLPEDVLRGAVPAPAPGAFDRASFERGWLVRAIWQSAAFPELERRLKIAAGAARDLLLNRGLLGVWEMARKFEGESRPWAEGLVAESAVMRQILYRIDRVAPTRATVLITGAPDITRELVAKAVHDAGDGIREATYVNLAGLAPTVIESELFGHEKGSYTGAHQRKIGLLESAGAGTLVLSGLEDLPLEIQAKLLRVLQERVFQRVGGNENIDFNARVLAVTDRDLGELVAEGRFREDLYHRLRVFQIEVPALKERPEDVLPLVRMSLDAIVGGLGLTSVPDLAPVAAAVARHPWADANELKIALTNAVAAALPWNTIQPNHLPAGVAASEKLKDPTDLSLEAMEAEILARAPAPESRLTLPVPTMTLRDKVAPLLKNYALEAITLADEFLVHMRALKTGSGAPEGLPELTRRMVEETGASEARVAELLAGSDQVPDLITMTGRLMGGLSPKTVRGMLHYYEIPTNARKRSPQWSIGSLPGFKDYEGEVEGEYMAEVLAALESRAGEGQQARAAGILGMSPSTFGRRLKAFLASQKAKKAQAERPNGQPAPAKK